MVLASFSESVWGSFRRRRPCAELAAAQKVQRLIDDLFRVHDEWVGIGEQQEIGHTLDPCPLHGHLAVVRSGDDVGKPGIEEAVLVSGDDAQRKVYRSELLRKSLGTGYELLSCGAVEPLATGGISQVIGGIAAPIRRAQHDDPAQILGPMSTQVVAHQHPAHGMGDEMNGPGLYPGVAPRAAHDGLQRQLLDCLFARWVVEIHRPESSSPESVCHLAQGAACPAEPVQQDYAFWSYGCRFFVLSRAEPGKTENNQRENQGGSLWFCALIMAPDLDPPDVDAALGSAEGDPFDRASQVFGCDRYRM
jgi:hypothetical protein